MSVGLNLGSESYGKGVMFRRPVLVLKKLSSYQCIAIPLSTKRKSGSWFCPVTAQGVERTALLHQTRALSASRFQKRIAQVDEVDMLRVRRQIIALFEL